MISKIVTIFFFSITSMFSSEWTTFNNNNTILRSNNINCIEIDSLGYKWFGTDDGLVHLNGNSWKLYTRETETNLADNYIKALKIESHTESTLLWVATSNGLTLVDITDPDSPIFTDIYDTTNSPLINNDIKAVTVDPNRARWIGTFSGISALYNNTWSTYSTENYWIDHDKVVVLETGPDSMVYIGTEGGGVSRLKIDGVDGITSASTLNTEYTGFDEPDSGKLTSDNVYSILIEENGNQWFGTDDGIALHTSYNTRRDWKNYNEEDGVINNFIKSICKEKENVFWFGTPNGVSRFDGHNWINFSTIDGLADNNVRDIAIDFNGTIWFATENGISALSDFATSVNTNDLNSSNSLGISSFPNPFNMQTSIDFSIETKSDIKLEVYNCNGQKIKSIVTETLGKGKHSYTWNGSNQNGSVVPSGIYFVKLTAGRQKKSHKIVLMK